MRRLVPVCIALFVLVASSTAWAHNIVGNWKSSAGDSVKIQVQGDGSIRVHIWNGHKNFDHWYTGAWDQPGRRFHFGPWANDVMRCDAKSDTLIESHAPNGNTGQWVRLNWK